MLLLVKIIFLLMIAGCATQPLPTKERYFWPPPPDRPRLEWLKAYHSQLDMEKSGGQRFWAAILGEDNPNALVKPIEVKSDAKNNKFFVSDLGTQSVFVFDLSLHEVRLLKSDDKGPPIKYPLGMALDTENNLFLLEQHSKSILVFDQNEKPLRYIKIGATCKRPLAITLDNIRNRILVVDGDARKIFVFDVSGKPLFSFGEPGEGNGKFNLPIAIAINSRDEIIVADAFNANVQIFDSKGTFKYKFGKRGDGTGDFQLLKSIAVDSEDNIYVVDGRSHRVLIFNTSGELLLVFGDYYAVSSSGKLAPGGFAIPVSIDIDKNDKVFVVDQLNSRVQVFQYISHPK
ncbi:MAG TPA: 6-bladed beta-propeller [Desulfuromonadaceae bacterium]|jgi:DNA-binding beta-propeller fold protein YncE